jgi:hypothetical protein
MTDDPMTCALLRTREPVCHTFQAPNLTELISKESLSLLDFMCFPVLEFLRKKIEQQGERTSEAKSKELEAKKVILLGLYELVTFIWLKAPLICRLHCIF